jgi:pantothenate kinase type III
MAWPAFNKYGGPCVIVDFGTTINFDVISATANTWAAPSR